MGGCLGVAAPAGDCLVSAQTKYLSRWQEIKKVEIERETEASVWVKGSKRAKSTSWERYHDTYEDARRHVINEAEKEVATARRELETAERKLATAKALKEVAS